MQGEPENFSAIFIDQSSAAGHERWGVEKDFPMLETTRCKALRHFLLQLQVPGHTWQPCARNLQKLPQLGHQRSGVSITVFRCQLEAGHNQAKTENEKKVLTHLLR